ncbi:MAG: MotA/TolQ/ExbB proton channel family protein [Myxococcota bacterium]|jgi:biopolymer transport protein ExbB|nr:MotA/TolQ/ExbB proton channel family protein [Myxococcota bacterium]
MLEFLDKSIDYLVQGGLYIMVPLLISAAVLWFALGYRAMTLRRGNRRSVRVLVEKYEASYERQPAGIIDTAVTRGLVVAKAAPPNLRQHLDGEFVGLEAEMSRFVTLVRSIVAVAPLLGLLGTVIGMIETFDSLGDMTMFSQSGGIAGGIAQALLTTQMGLAVSIPGVIVGGALERRQDVLEQELDKLKDILCTRYAGGEK